MNVLVTGTAGFIGFHVARYLLARGDSVVGLDVVNDYYDPELKRARLLQLEIAADTAQGRYAFVEADLADQHDVDAVFESYDFDRVIHLAAQPGVRYSLENPRAYIHSNIDGFLNILEACRFARTPHLSYASTSSVYGANRRLPYAEDQEVGHPLALYAATKRANELMAHSYSHLYRLPTTGLRFFTVYGPWGRPDMSPFLFTSRILAGEPIDVFNGGNHSRDFTYIDDIVEGVVRSSDQIAEPNPDWDAASPDPASSDAPYRVFNIGNSQPVALIDFIEAIELATGKTAQRNLLPLQPGDVPDTAADVSRLEAAVGYRPDTPVVDGVRQYVDWYREYYRV